MEREEIKYGLLSKREEQLKFHNQPIAGERGDVVNIVDWLELNFAINYLQNAHLCNQLLTKLVLQKSDNGVPSRLAVFTRVTRVQAV